jgi:hypothetical protein
MMKESVMETRMTTVGILFEVHESKPWGISDEDHVSCVLFSPDQPIPDFPQTAPFGFIGTELYWIPQREVWVGFNYSAFPERSNGPYEVSITGPFLVSDEPSPTDTELELSCLRSQLIRRVRQDDGPLTLDVLSTL